MTTPSLDGALLVIEDDETSDAGTFARDLTSLLQVPNPLATFPIGGRAVLAVGPGNSLSFADS